MKKKHLFLSLAALLSVGVVSFLASCSGAKDDRIQVEFWHCMGKANQEKLDAMIETFEAAHPNIHVNYSQQGGYTDIESKINKAIPAKRVPTMAMCYADHVAGYIDNAIDMTSFVNSTAKVLDKDGVETDEIIGLTAEEKADYIQGYWEEGEEYAKSGIYSFPFSKSTEVLFYNATWFKAHGLVDASGNPIVPTKWENKEDPNDLTAMWNLCRKIKEIDSTITPLGYDSDDNMYITLSAQYGIPYTSMDRETGKGSFDFNNEQAKALVKDLKGYYDKGYFVTKGTLENNTYTSTKFKKGQLLMSIGSTGGTSYNIPNKDADGIYDFDAQVAQIPQQSSERDYQISQGPSIVFFQNSKITDEQLQASWLFYKHITQPVNSANYSILTGYEPVRSSSYTTEEYTAHLGKLGTDEETLYTRVANLTATEKVQNSYFVSPAFKGSSTARTQCGGIITLVLFEKATGDALDKRIDDIFRKAAEECRIAAL